MIWNIKKQKINQSEQEETGIQKNRNSVSSLWDNFKRSNICFMGLPEGAEKEQEVGNICEKIMKENFPNLVKEINIHVQEAQSPKHIDPKRPTQRHIIIEMPKVKDKERILKAAREKRRFTYRGVPIRLSADFSKELAG